MRIGMRWFTICLSLLGAVLLPASLAAQEREVPYWASMRAPEVNLRVGPSQDYPIEWVYKRQGLPVKVLRVREGWRLISDPDGTKGWVVARLLDPQRTALVVGQELAAIRAEPSDASALKWNAEPGVVGRLGRCESGWCKFDVAGRDGWIRESRLWGVGEP